MKKYYSKKYLSLLFLLLLITTSGLAQQQIFTGTINDDAGNPVENAMITIKDQPGIKVYTDKEGKFSIMGQKGQTIEVLTRGLLKRSLRLESDQIVLSMNGNDALVPIGNRLELRSEEVTSAIGVARAGELTKSSVFKPANALYGKIPGLTVLQNGGTSWDSDPDMFIRGVETFGIGSFVNTEILTIVDGFELPLSSVSLAEIESVAVLKDAAALAVYGLRGANGVLLVTTKRGTGTGLSIDINYEHGFTRAFRLPEFLNAHDYASAVNQAREYDGLNPLYTMAELNRYKSGNSPFLYPDVDWIGESLRDWGWSNKLNISFQEQLSSIRYFAILNYDEEEGLLGPVNLNKDYSTQSYGRRFNFRGNIDISLTRSTRLAVKLAGNLGQNTRPSTSNGEYDIISSIYNTPSSSYPVRTYNSDTKGAKYWGGKTTYGYTNPVALIAATGTANHGRRELITDFLLEQDLDGVLKGLSAEAGVSNVTSFDYLDRKTWNFQYEQITPVVDPETGNVNDTSSVVYGSLPAMIFSTSIPFRWRRSAFFADLKYSTEWDDNSLSSMLLLQMEGLVKSGQSNTFRHLLAAGTVHYGKAGKYFADLALAYNGTNVLPAGSRFGFFPALSIGWNISNEDWMSSNEMFDHLKLRASWGMTGNDQIIQNISETTWESASGYYFTANNTSNSGFAERRFAATPLTFETSYKSNLGVDASIFRMLDINLDLFYDKRKGILVETGGSILGILGVSPPYSSSGITSNKGIEMGFNLHQEGKDFNYNVGGQLSFTRSKIIEMLEVYRPEEYLKRTGQSINQAFGLEAVGFFKDASDISGSPLHTFGAVRPGDIKYKDQNGDNIINSFDEVPVGHNTRVPELYYSGAFGIEYKGIGIDIFLQGIANQTIYLNTPNIFWPLVNNANISTFSGDAWSTATASTATLPRLTTLHSENNYRPNTVWFTDGSYLKLRSAEIYFDLPRQFASVMKLDNFRIYVRGMNLFSIDKIKVVDPEATGITYPATFSYNVGIKIGF